MKRKPGEATGIIHHNKTTSWVRGKGEQGEGEGGLTLQAPPTRPLSDIPPTNAQLAAGLTFDLGGPARLTCIRYARARCGRLLGRRLAGPDIVGRLHHQSHRSSIVAATEKELRKYTTRNDSLSVGNWNYLAGPENGGSGWGQTEGGRGQRSPKLRWVSVFMRDGPR